MLLITFGRAASQELRERVREQLVLAERELAARLADPAHVLSSGLLAHVGEGDTAQVEDRRRRLRTALAGFDSATIATTHQFCQLVLRSLGVAGDSDAGVSLVDDLDDLITEVVDDLYLARFQKAADKPKLTRADALALARAVAGNPHPALVPTDPPDGSPAPVRFQVPPHVPAELEPRTRPPGIPRPAT